MKLPEEQVEFCLFLETKTEVMRGKIINNAIAIEQIIDNFISCYLIPSKGKRGQFIELILQKTSFRNRIIIFKNILKTYERELFNMHKDDLKKIEDLLDLRNKFAHSKIDSTAENLRTNFMDRKNIYMIEIKHGIPTQTIESISELEQTISDNLDLIDRFNDWVRKYTETITQ